MAPRRRSDLSADDGRFGQRDLPLVGPGVERQCEVKWWAEEARCFVEVRTDDQASIIGEAADFHVDRRGPRRGRGEGAPGAVPFFEALVHVRRHLERDGEYIRCCGTSLDVYPSGMAREMGLGLGAYRIKPGRRATLADIVGTFDDDTFWQMSTVGKQRRNWESWTRQPWDRLH